MSDYHQEHHRRFEHDRYFDDCYYRRYRGDDDRYRYRYDDSYRR